MTKQSSGPLSFIIPILFLVLPLVYVQAVIDHSLVPRQAFASAVVLLMVVLLWSSASKSKISLSFPLLFYAGFVVFHLIALPGAINTAEAWGQISRYFLGAAFLTAILISLQSGQLKVRHLVSGGLGLGAIAGISTLFLLLQLISQGNFVTDIYEISGLFGHKNLLSSALMLSFPFVAMGYFTFRQKTWRQVSLIVLVILLVEMFVLRTRGVWVGVFGAGVLSLGVLYWQKAKSGQTVLPLKSIGLLGALAIVILAGLFSLSGFRQNITDRTNIDNRLLFWQNSLEMVAEKPLTGVGPGQWRIYFPKYGLSRSTERGVHKLDQSVSQGETHIQRPHNDYLWVWTEGGPLALICFLGLFASALWRIRKRLIHDTNPSERAIDVINFFGLLAYLIFSLTDFPLERTTHHLLMLALVALPYRPGLEHKAVVSAPGRLILFLALLGSLISLIISGYRWQGEARTKEVLDYNRTRNAQRIVPAAERAINSFYTLDNFGNPLPYFSSIGRLAQGQVAEAEQDAADALELHPYNIVAINQMGNCLRHQQKWDQAIDYYQRALEISQWMVAARIGLAQVYVQQRDAVHAMEALALIPRQSQDPRYAQLLGQVLPQLVGSFEEHGRYEPLVRYLQQKRPQSREDYVRYFRQFRLSPSDANAQGSQ